MTNTLAAAQPYFHSSKKWKELTNSVTCFIVKDCLPVHSVSKDGFKAMIRKFYSMYDLPSSTYFSRTAIPKLYTATKERVKKELRNVEYFCSINKNMPYFALAMEEAECAVAGPSIRYSSSFFLTLTYKHR